jgi:predicted small secreted protein
MKDGSWFIGVIFGIAIATIFFHYIIGEIEQKNQTQLVQLGVGFYDFNTGVFKTKKCEKQ